MLLGKLRALILGLTAVSSDFERTQLGFVTAVGPHFLWRTRDEETKGRDHGCGVVGLCRWRLGPNRPARRHIAWLRFAKYPGIYCSPALGCPAAESRDDGGGDAVERRRCR